MEPFSEEPDFSTKPGGKSTRQWHGQRTRHPDIE
jgi:hypothetical protein